MNRDNWFFDNITEDVVYGPIGHVDKLVTIARKIKKMAIIRKLARDNTIVCELLPDVLENAVGEYRIKYGVSK